MDNNETIKTERPCERVEILKVPVDIVAREDLPRIVFELLEKKTGQDIVLLSLWDLLRARRTGEFRNYLKNAALIIPISKSIVSGIRFLTGKTAARYMPFDFIVNILTILESRELSIYLLGGKPSSLVLAEKNIHETFPKLRIVGRFPGIIKKQTEETLLKVIRKSAPSLLLIGQGVSGRERWVAKNTLRLNSGLRLWCSDIYDVFAKRRRRPSRAVFDRGLEWIGFCFQNPVRFFRVFPYIRYIFLILFYKIFKKNGSGAIDAEQNLPSGQNLSSGQSSSAIGQNPPAGN
ncbi:MAG: WecB/TagA/CpsF family glycosyltransferase [Spirochaetaceae bacterium]|nr:WecB/TagA/CpsF family glycosyltransferase [Spirochaetaceae bacterium]